MMRAVRLAIATLIALALAVLPMSAGFAKQRAVAKAEMSMGAPDEACPGCDTTHARAADACSLNCCGAAAILVEAQPLTGQRCLPAGDRVAAAPAPFTLPPDPPPPRS